MAESSGHGNGHGNGHSNGQDNAAVFNPDPIGLKVVKDPDDDTIERFECTECPRDDKGKPQCRIRAENCVEAYQKELENKMRENGGRTRSLTPSLVEKLTLAIQAIIHTALHNDRFKAFAPFDVSFGWGPKGDGDRGIVISFHNEDEQLLEDHRRWRIGNEANENVEKRKDEKDRRRYFTPLYSACHHFGDMIREATKGLSPFWNLPQNFVCIATVKNAQQLLDAAAKEDREAEIARQLRAAARRENPDAPIESSDSEDSFYIDTRPLNIQERFQQRPSYNPQNEQYAKQQKWLEEWQQDPERDEEEEDGLDEGEKEKRREEREARKAFKEMVKKKLQPGFEFAEIEEQTNMFFRMKIGTFIRDGDELLMVSTKEDRNEQARLT